MTGKIWLQEIHAPTLADSTIALGSYNSGFLIRAATGAPAISFDSAADSGYSLDNLAPGAPSNFVYTVGLLTWNESSAADFDYFTFTVRKPTRSHRRR